MKTILKTNIGLLYLVVLGLIAIATVSSCSRFEQCGEFVDGIAVAQNSKYQYTYIDEDGKVINPKAVFEDAKDFSEGFGVVRFEDLTYGLVDKTITVVTTERYASLTPFSNGYARFSKNQTIGILDKNLKVVLEPTYYSISDFSEELARVKGEHGYGFINSNFELVIPCKYSEASNFSGGASVVIYEGQRGFIDVKDSFHAVDVDMIYPFSDDVAKVRKTDRYGDKYGYINKKGVFIVPCEYDEVLDFSEGLCAVCKRYKTYGFEDWSYFDKEGNKPFTDTFDHATSFSNGRAEVVKGSAKYYINRDGRRENERSQLEKEQDYSWLYEGKWVARDQGDLFVYSFKPDGSCVCYYEIVMFGASAYKYGRYTIKDGGIYTYMEGDEIFSGPGFLAHIEGRSLTYNGGYFEHIY